MVKRTVLPCGLTVISESFKEFPSISLSYTMKSGSRHETELLHGAHHFIEHMIFKGTDKYNQREIASLSARLGNTLNAQTSKEITQFFIKSIDEKLDRAFQLVSDIVLNAIFPCSEFSREKQVIIQEIDEGNDNPQTLAFETFYEKIFRGHALAHPIAGKVQTIATIKRDDLYSFYRQKYTPENLILAAVGKLEHDHLVDLAENACVNFKNAIPIDWQCNPAEYRPIRASHIKDSLRQTYIIIAFNALSSVSAERRKLLLLNTILGSGINSRLFQAVREQRGLAYSIGSSPDFFYDCGLLTIYAIVAPDQAIECIAVIRSELELLVGNGVNYEELEQAKDQIKSSIILGSEHKMQFNLKQELYFHKEELIADILNEITSVRCEDINDLIKRILNMPQMTLFTMGPQQYFK